MVSPTLFLGLVPLTALIPVIGFAWCRDRYTDWRIQRRGLKHPFTKGLRRPPGYSLAQEISNLQLEGLARVLYVMLIGVAVVVVVMVVSGVFGLSALAGLFLGMAAAFAYGCFEAWRFGRLLSSIRRKRLGWEGELATGEALNRLYSHGYDIFHDLDCGGFNIDHIAVGPSGVFAIETKARVKETSGRSSGYWQATFDGRSIDFGTFRTNGPLKQAQRNAEWLSRKLSSAVGENVPVQGVVALPGWFVNRQGRSDVRVVNPTEFESMTRGARQTRIEATLISRVIHQLDALSRNVAKDKIVVR